jgi:hypothetical protein
MERKVRIGGTNRIVVMEWNEFHFSGIGGKRLIDIARIQVTRRSQAGPHHKIKIGWISFFLTMLSILVKKDAVEVLTVNFIFQGNN